MNDSREDAKARNNLEHLSAIVVDCGYKLQGFRADIIIEDRLLIELKSVENLLPVHSKQVLTYLRLLKFSLGLLINFGAPRFKDGCKRIVNQHTETQSSRLRLNRGSHAKTLSSEETTGGMQ